MTDTIHIKNPSASYRVLICYDGEYTVKDKNHFLTFVIKWFISVFENCEFVITSPSNVKHLKINIYDTAMLIFENKTTANFKTLCESASKICANNKFVITQDPTSSLYSLSDLSGCPMLDYSNVIKNCNTKNLSFNIATAIICFIEKHITH